MAIQKIDSPWSQAIAGRKQAMSDIDTVNQTNANGGTSANYHTGASPSSGYMVGGTIPSMAVNAESFGPHDVQSMRQRISNNYQGNVPSDMHVGTWKSPNDGQVWLDASQHHSDLNTAMQAGQSRGEQAIYDVKNGSEIDTGGTGNAE